MSRSLYEVGRAGLVRFIEALADVIEHDVKMTDDEAAGVPMMLFKAKTELLATWDKVSGVKPLLKIRD